MKVDKSYKIAAVVIIIAAFLIFENTLLRPAPAFRYNGVQIYDAIRDLKGLDYRGFDITVHVEGKSNNALLKMEGKVTETSAGWFIINSGNAYRIVEGPMGSKDVLADLIYFDVTPRISVEAVFSPEKTGKFLFKPGFRKVMGSIAFDNARIDPTLLQQLRNLNSEFYSLNPGRIEITTYGSGFILDMKSPVSISELEGLVGRIDSVSAQTGYMYYYAGADDENAIQNVRQEMEGKGAVLVNYYKQR